MPDESRKRPARTNPLLSKSIATPDKKSRAKSDASFKSVKAAAEAAEEEQMPLASDGRPLTKISFCGMELIPTGDYANVTLGPVMATMWIDPLSDEPVSQAELNGIIQASNKLAETVLRDILGVQRNIVLEALQTDVENDD